MIHPAVVCLLLTSSVGTQGGAPRTFAVTGTVTDRTGKPVAGATVFNNADGPRPTQAITDAAGRFTLNGLYQGPAYVAVKVKDFRLATVLAEAGGPAVS